MQPRTDTRAAASQRTTRRPAPAPVTGEVDPAPLPPPLPAGASRAALRGYSSIDLLAVLDGLSTFTGHDVVERHHSALHPPQPVLVPEHVEHDE